MSYLYHAFSFKAIKDLFNIQGKPVVHAILKIYDRTGFRLLVIENIIRLKVITNASGKKPESGTF